MADLNYNVSQSARASVSSFHLHASKMMWRMIQLDILPYYILIAFYLHLYSPSLPHPHEAAGSAILKILPILYLMMYAGRRRGGRGKPPQSGVTGQISSQTEISNLENDNQVSNEHPLNEKAGSWLTGSIASLTVCSIGDVCLVYKDLFLFGVFFFCIAHVMYLLVLKKLYKTSSKAWVAVPLCCLLYSVMLIGTMNPMFKVIVLVYAILIHCMLFFAIASYESYPSASTCCYMFGATLFVVSDFLIACNKWLQSTPHSELTILSTYYLAQVLLTLASC